MTGTPGHVVATTPDSVLADNSRLHLRAEVRDKSYAPSSDARVEAHIMGPGNVADTVQLRPDPAEPGVFTADWSATKAVRISPKSSRSAAMRRSAAMS